jgi:pyruvate dehydrogenase E2 component (dihydrolipoamide acetyltransferase)
MRNGVMAVEITVPRLGWNMEEGVFVGWLKKEGDEVRRGDALFTLEGEKATEDIECLETGILRIPADSPKPGDKLAVGAVIGYVVQPGEAIPRAALVPSHLAREGRGVAGDAIQDRAAPPRQPSAAKGEGEKPAASPRARRAARELGVDWTKMQGGGRTGRIRERDVRAASGRKTVPQGAGTTVSPIRKTVAQRVTTSLRSTAPVTLTTTADATNLVNLRSQFKAVPPTGGEAVPGYTDFLVKLTAAALHKHLALAAHWIGEAIVPAASIDIGIAVDTDAGLLVPVVRGVPGLSLRQLAAHTRELAERARAGTLRAAEMEGGAFTVTNLGEFGVDAFTPIIHYPQCAILGVGRIQRRPVAVGDQIAVRDEVTLSLTFDHRIVDGAPAARFLKTLAQYVENPGPWLMP